MNKIFLLLLQLATFYEQGSDNEKNVSISCRRVISMGRYTRHCGVSTTNMNKHYQKTIEIRHINWEHLIHIAIYFYHSFWLLKYTCISKSVELHMFKLESIWCFLPNTTKRTLTLQVLKNLVLFKAPRSRVSRYGQMITLETGEQDKIRFYCPIKGQMNI